MTNIDMHYTRTIIMATLANWPISTITTIINTTTNSTADTTTTITTSTRPIHYYNQTSTTELGINRYL